jgi:hypothetical protein
MRAERAIDLATKNAANSYGSLDFSLYKETLARNDRAYNFTSTSCPANARREFS